MEGVAVKPPDDSAEASGERRAPRETAPERRAHVTWSDVLQNATSWSATRAWPSEASSAYHRDAAGHAMPLRLVDLQDRFRAAVLGFAIGDALGFPLRGHPAPGLARLNGIADEFATRPRGRYAKGQFSDDTQLLLAAAQACTRERRIDGKANAAQLAALWQEGVILQPPAPATEAANQLLEGTPWMSAGAPLGVREPSCLSRGVVLGLWAEVSPPKLAHQAQVLTVVTHKDPVCSAAVVAVARAVQLGLAGAWPGPNEACAAIAHAVAAADQALADEIFYLPRVLAWEPVRALEALKRVGVSSAQYDFDAGLPAHVTPVLLVALYAALKAPHDVRAALAMVLKLGGEVDVAAGLTGALLGAASGCAGLPARLKKNVLYAEELVAAADALFDAKVTHAPVSVPALATVRR
jgi:ADP-ribosylglycohydrolase